MKNEITPNSKIPLKIILGTAAYLAAYLLTIVILSSFADRLPYGSALIGTVAFLAGGIAAFLTVTRDERGLLFYNPSAAFADKKRIIPFLIALILTAYALTVVFNYLFTLIPWHVFGSKNIYQNNESFYSIPLYLRLISYVLIGPFAEEVLFRIVLFSRLRKIIPFIVAALLSSLLFGLYHGNLMQGLYALIMGTAICLFMEEGGSVIYAYLFHVAANLVSNLCYEFEYINNVVYSIPGIVICFVYLVVAITIYYVFKRRLTKKDKQC